MNVVLYFVCLLLLLPMAGLAAFGFVIDSLAHAGLWAVIKIALAPLFEPFGRGLWLYLGLLSLGGLCITGFLPAARPYGFGAIAAIGIGCAVYVLRVYPNDWAHGPIAFFLPTLISVGVSISCIVRPLR